MNKITLLVVDDHRLIRDSWSAVLNNDSRLEVIAAGMNGEEAIQIARTHKPDIVLMDINMSPIDGFEATKAIRRYSPGSKVIGVSMHNIPAYARKMMQSGAFGYITKNSPKEEMITAILEVNNGKKYICNEVKDILANETISSDHLPPGMKALSLREINIIQLLKEGLISREIAERLSISLKTVEVHRYNILRKLQLKNTASLINFVNCQGVA